MFLFFMKFYIPRLIAFTVAFFIALAAYSDGSRALRLLEKKDYEKLIDHLDRSLEKDTVNPGAKYVYSLLYLDSAFARFDIDTSYQYINAALKALPLLEIKDAERLAKDNITDSTMRLQKTKVETAGYRRARQTHTLEAYNYFLRYFSGAAETDSAIYHRNAIAYRQVVEEDTYQAFRNFIYTYPNALQLNDAKVNYERLLFHSKTADGKLDTYIQFLRNNPDTPHRREAEKMIFEIVTADNEVNSYLWFLENYPNSEWRSKVFDFLYHRYKETSGPQGFLNRFANYVFSDSLKRMAKAELKVIFPVYDEGKYGFADEKGNILIPFSYDSLNEALLCGNIRHDFLEVASGDTSLVVSRLGHEIFRGEYESLEDIGSGLLKIEQNDKYGLVHKSGRLLLDFDFEDIALLNNNFVKIKLGEKWGLVSLLGRQLLKVKYDEIASENNFIMIKKGDYYAVQNVNALRNAAQGDAIELAFSFDDYILLDDNHLLVFSGENETLIDNKLEIVSNAEGQEIHRYFGGWLAKTKEGYRVYDLIFHPLSALTFTDVQKSTGKIALKWGDHWGIYYQGSDFPGNFTYESVIFLGDNISIINDGEETFAAFSQDTLVEISENREVRLLKPQISDPAGKEVPEYLLVKNKRGVYSVYNSSGIEVLDGRFDDVDAIGFEYLEVSKNGKKGLFHSSGKQLLRTSYQGLGNYNEGYVSTLLNHKFGIYNYNKNELLLSAKHEKMLRIFGDEYFISEKDGKLAFVNTDNDLVSDYEFDRIEPWNDTISLVKKDDFWALYDIKNQQYTFEEIEIVEGMDQGGAKDPHDREIFLFITKNSQEGVLSNISGKIVGPTFNDVYNVGDRENPIFFAEKYIPEAEFYIVIYYDKTGQIIKKQVFTGDEYWKIYCEG